MVVKRPAYPGLDYCGRVVSCPSFAFRPGQLVFGTLGAPIQFDALAEYIVAPSNGTAILPTGVSPDHAACIGVTGQTAYQSIVPNVKAGDRVFINGGSGGTGVFGIQIAKTIGCFVTTTCSTANVDLCKSLGADEVIDYKKMDVSSKLAEGRLMFDLVVDNVGTPQGLYSSSHHFLKPEGKFVQVGADVSLSGVSSMTSRMALPGILGGGKRKFEVFGMKTKAEELDQIAKWMAEGKVNAVVDETFALEDAREAYQKIRSGRAKGKIVVRLSSH